MFLQARKISPVFQLQPNTVYLVNEFDNVAVFPNDTSGRFNRSLINPSAVYAVHGEEMGGSTPFTPSPAANSGALTPFGAYHGPMSQLPPPRPQLSLRRKSTTFRKTVAVVSLSYPSSNKASTSKATFHLDYKIVTQVVVTLEVGNCSPDIVADLIKQQVGFQVVLLDSKCFPILESDTTTGTDYWKSNRKILAASKSLYTRLTGSSANVKRANNAVDLTNSDEEGVAPPKSKCCCLSSNKLDKILDTVEAIKERNDVIEKISGLFECVVCREIVQRPHFSPCCKRVVGCQQCVSRWFRDHNACPHCSTSGVIDNYTDLRGADDLLGSLRILRGNSSNRGTTESETVEDDGSDSSDFELPAFNIRNHNA